MTTRPPQLAAARVEALGPVGEGVAGRIKQVRRERGLTLRELAARLEGIGRPILLSALSKVEQGQRRIDVDDLVALADALDVTPKDLLVPKGTSDSPELASARSLTPSRSLMSGDALEQGDARPIRAVLRSEPGHAPAKDSQADGWDAVRA